jgi:hypothetical protein
MLLVDGMRGKRLHVLLVGLGGPHCKVHDKPPNGDTLPNRTLPPHSYL